MKNMKKHTHKKNKLKAVDFFCSGGGMSYGMQQSGIQIIAGIDFDINCKSTYETNINGAKFIHADVFRLTEQDLEDELLLKRNDDDLILIDKKKSAQSKNLLIEFSRFVKYFKPGYIVVENVPGILRRKTESGLEQFIQWLKDNNYNSIHCEIHNVNNYGVPQNRKRFTLIASRLTNEEIKPIENSERKKVVYDAIGVHNGFPKIEPGHKDNTNFLHTVPNISEINKKRLKKIKKDGGDRLGFADDKELQLKCFIGKNNSFKDTFGRLWWNKPSPTITTKFFSISNGRFVHPEEDRALSIREGATLQSFPLTYEFKGNSIANIARMIGNAVPPLYASAIGKAIIKSHKK